MRGQAGSGSRPRARHRAVLLYSGKGRRATWAKVADSFFGDLPVLGLLSGYVFHPSYLISANGSGAALRAKKQPSLLESTFRLDRLPARLTPDEERLLVIGMVVVLLGERRRG